VLTKKKDSLSVKSNFLFPRENPSRPKPSLFKRRKTLKDVGRRERAHKCALVLEDQDTQMKTLSFNENERSKDPGKRAQALKTCPQPRKIKL